jgi:hypothetical protein
VSTAMSVEQGHVEIVRCAQPTLPGARCSLCETTLMIALIMAAFLASEAAVGRWERRHESRRNPSCPTPRRCRRGPTARQNRSSQHLTWLERYELRQLTVQFLQNVDQDFDGSYFPDVRFLFSFETRKAAQERHLLSRDRLITYPNYFPSRLHSDGSVPVRFGGDSRSGNDRPRRWLLGQLRLSPPRSY